MQLAEYIAKGFQILRFQAAPIQEIAADANHKRNALILTTIMAALVSAVYIGFIALAAHFGFQDFSLPTESAFSGLFLLVMFFIIFIICFAASIISVGILHLLSRLFGGQATILQFYAVLTSTSVGFALLAIPLIGALFIPFVGSLVMLAYNAYALVLETFIIRETYKLSTGKAIGVIVALFALIFFLVIIAMIALFALLGGLPATSM